MEAAKHIPSPGGKLIAATTTALALGAAGKFRAKLGRIHKQQGSRFR